jgi:hypothetical protein
MKLFVTLMVAAGLGFVAGWLTVSNQLSRQHAARLLTKEAAWLAEKQRLLAQLDASRRNRPSPVIVQAPVAFAEPTIPNTASPAEILDRLKTFRLGPGQGRSARQLIYYFESLAELGADALPVIRDFLARNEDFEYTGDSRRGQSLIPASLRLGLFDVLRRIGGHDAEGLLGDVLKTTARGLEIVAVTRILEEIAPGKYREIALASAHELLANPVPVTQPGRLDQRSRDHLFDVLAMYKDTSFAATAQTQLVRADGQIDRTALRYLERTTGDQYLSYVQQAYNDPRTGPDQKQPLVEAVIERVGQQPQAAELLHSMVIDERLPSSVRQEAIRELDNHGINEENPGARDLPIILARKQLLQALRPDLRDANLLQFVDRIAGSLDHLLARAQQPRPQPPQ